MSGSVFRLQILDCFDFKPLQSNSLYILYTYAAITTNYDTTGNIAPPIVLQIYLHLHFKTAFLQHICNMYVQC